MKNKKLNPPKGWWTVKDHDNNITASEKFAYNARLKLTIRQRQLYANSALVAVSPDLKKIRFYSMGRTKMISQLLSDDPKPEVVKTLPKHEGVKTGRMRNIPGSSEIKTGSVIYLRGDLLKGCPMTVTEAYGNFVDAVWFDKNLCLQGNSFQTKAITT